MPFFYYNSRSCSESVAVTGSGLSCKNVNSQTSTYTIPLASYIAWN